MKSGPKLRRNSVSDELGEPVRLQVKVTPETNLRWETHYLVDDDTWSLVNQHTHVPQTWDLQWNIENTLRELKED